MQKKELGFIGAEKEEDLGDFLKEVWTLNLYFQRTVPVYYIKSRSKRNKAQPKIERVFHIPHTLISPKTSHVPSNSITTLL